jgi:hypothetical protein
LRVRRGCLCFSEQNAAIGREGQEDQQHAGVHPCSVPAEMLQQVEKTALLKHKDVDL